MTVLDLKEIKQEWAFFLRNNDIFTTTQRGVTTTAATGTFASASSFLLNVPNVKNVRSVVVDGSTLVYGQDYTVDIDYNDSGTIKMRIAFTSAQTGAYTITYDYGTDKIYPDFPKPNLTLSSYPRIGCDIVNIPTAPGGFGNVNVSTIDVTIVVYDPKTEAIADYITAIRTAIITAQTSFYFVGKVVKPLNIGPVVSAQREKGKDKIWQQNIDARGSFQYEKN